MLEQCYYGVRTVLLYHYGNALRGQKLCFTRYKSSALQGVKAMLSNSKSYALQGIKALLPMRIGSGRCPAVASLLGLFTMNSMLFGTFFELNVLSFHSFFLNLQK
jgi:hypothetical protein